VTDQGLVHLGGVTRLWDLNRSGTRVTDQGLGQLQRLTRLRRLRVVDTKVAELGVVSLRQVLPRAKVARPVDDLERDDEDE
jgi:hypothetical protein